MLAAPGIASLLLGVGQASSLCTRPLRSRRAVARREPGFHGVLWGQEPFLDVTNVLIYTGLEAGNALSLWMRRVGDNSILWPEVGYEACLAG